MNILKIIASLIIGFLIALGCVSFGWNVLLIKGSCECWELAEWAN